MVALQLQRKRLAVPIARTSMSNFDEGAEQSAPRSRNANNSVSGVNPLANPRRQSNMGGGLDFTNENPLLANRPSGSDQARTRLPFSAAESSSASGMNEDDVDRQSIFSLSQAFQKPSIKTYVNIQKNEIGTRLKFLDAENLSSGGALSSYPQEEHFYGLHNFSYKTWTAQNMEKYFLLGFKEYRKRSISEYQSMSTVSGLLIIFSMILLMRASDLIILLQISNASLIPANFIGLSAIFSIISNILTIFFSQVIVQQLNQLTTHLDLVEFIEKFSGMFYFAFFTLASSLAMVTFSVIAYAATYFGNGIGVIVGICFICMLIFMLTVYQKMNEFTSYKLDVAAQNVIGDGPNYFDKHCSPCLSDRDTMQQYDDVV